MRCLTVRRHRWNENEAERERPGVSRRKTPGRPACLGVELASDYGWNWKLRCRKRKNGVFVNWRFMTSSGRSLT